MTPALPTRDRRSGISGSFTRELFISLDRGDDRLNGNPSVRDQLATRTPRRCAESGSPQVLPDEHSGGASRIHGSGEVLDVLLGQQLRQLGLKGF